MVIGVKKVTAKQGCTYYQIIFFQYYFPNPFPSLLIESALIYSVLMDEYAFHFQIFIIVVLYAFLPAKTDANLHCLIPESKLLLCEIENLQLNLFITTARKVI